MREPGSGTRQVAGLRQNLQADAESQRAERDEDRTARQQSQLPSEVFTTVFDLLRQRAIAGRRAPAGRRQERAVKLESVVGRAGLGMAR
jgi:hypothetical protein